MPRRTRIIILGCAALVVLAVTAVFAARWWFAPPTVGQPEQSELDAPVFAAIVIPASPRIDDGWYLHPDTGEFGHPLRGVDREVVYDKGQTLEAVEQRVRAAAAHLGGEVLCVTLPAGEDSYELTASRALVATLTCNVFDANRDPVGTVDAWDDGAPIRVQLSYGPDSGQYAWHGITVDDLPPRD